MIQVTAFSSAAGDFRSRLLAFLLLFFLPPFLYSQSISWQNTIGGKLKDELTDAYATPDGGIILAGESTSGISGDRTDGGASPTGYGQDFWIIKLDSLGNIEWQNAIGGTGADYCRAIVRAPDGNYYVGGFSNSPVSVDKSEPTFGMYDYWVVKLDPAGNILWENTIGGSGYEQFVALDYTTDGGVILAGGSGSPVSGDKTEASSTLDYWILKLSSSGAIQWQATLGGTGSDIATWVKRIPSGGYIVSGISDSNISPDKSDNCRGNYDFWVIKLDDTGNVLWENTYGGSGPEINCDIFPSGDGGYLLYGTSESNTSGDKTENSNGGEDWWVLKLDSTGNVQWQNTIGGSDIDRMVGTIETDSGYICAGYSFSGISGDKTMPIIGGMAGSTDFWQVILDTAGNVISDRGIGGDRTDIGAIVSPASDGGYFLSGFSDSPISGDKNEDCFYDPLILPSRDYWVLKLGTCISPGIATAAAAGPDTICAGTTATLGLTGSLYSAMTWHWYTDSCGGVSAGFGDTLSLSPAVTTTYYVRAEGGCSTPGPCTPVTVTVQPSPVTYLGPDTSYCGLSPVLLDAGSGMSAYLWSSGETTSTLLISPSAGPLTSSVTVTSADGCTASDTIVLNFLIPPSPDLGDDTLICDSVSMILDAGSGMASYLWSTSEATQTIVFDAGVSGTGTFPVTVLVTDSSGCTGTDTILITVDICLGNSTASPSASWSVSPNPASDMLVVSALNRAGEGVFVLQNLLGETLITQTLQHNQVEVPVMHVAPGVYLIRILEKGNLVYSGKAIIVR